EANLASWQLAASPVAGGPVVAIANGTTLATDGAVTAPWTLTGLADGDYTLRLSATDKAAQLGSAERSVTVDNTPPTAAIAAPAEGGYVRRATPILGEATDAHFDHYELALAPGDGSGSPAWSPLGVGTTAVTA